MFAQPYDGIITPENAFGVLQLTAFDEIRRESEEGMITFESGERNSIEALLFSMLDYLGIEKGRTRVEWVSAAEGVKFSQTMNEFVETIRSLGKNVRLGDLRCKN